MGNILLKNSFDKKEEEFEKMWNENFQSSGNLSGYHKKGNIFSKGKSYGKSYEKSPKTVVFAATNG